MSHNWVESIAEAFAFATKLLETAVTWDEEQAYSQDQGPRSLRLSGVGRNLGEQGSYRLQVTGIEAAITVWTSFAEDDRTAFNTHDWKFVTEA